MAQLIETIDPAVKFPSAALATSTPYASGRYAFVPTMQIVEVLTGQGWIPHSAQQLKVKDPQREGYQKHLIRFRKEAKSVIKKEQLYPEVVLINGHDLRERGELHAGFLRCVCLNGLMVADSLFESVKIKHTMNAVQMLLDALERVVSSFPAIVHRINNYREITLTPDEQGIFAEAAVKMRWPDEKSREGLDLQQLIAPRRKEDAEPTLWSTFNILQEKLVQTGGVSFNRQKYSRVSKSVTAIAENRRMNTGLWSLTEQMAKYKEGSLVAA